MFKQIKREMLSEIRNVISLSLLCLLEGRCCQAGLLQRLYEKDETCKTPIVHSRNIISVSCIQTCTCLLKHPCFMFICGQSEVIPGTNLLSSMEKNKNVHLKRKFMYIILSHNQEFLLTETVLLDNIWLHDKMRYLFYSNWWIETFFLFVTHKECLAHFEIMEEPTM